MATNSKIGTRTPVRVLPHKLKSVSQARKDISDLKRAKALALNAENPNNWALQSLLNNIMDDAHLTSQIGNRKEQVFSSNYGIYLPNGKVDPKGSLWVQTSETTPIFIETILDSLYYGYSIAELNYSTDGQLFATDLPRMNAIPQKGIWLPDYHNQTEAINYRELKEFGNWIFEFNKINLGKEYLGLLVKAIVHVLFKRFAQSCWSELCEIYGIPPRWMKTNTQDPAMLNRADQMMKDMGAAAYFIIDETEELQFAQGVNTNGDVYRNLMTVCNNEMSLLVSGAIIGQDTKYGSNNKDQSAQEMLWLKVQADMRDVQTMYNTRIIPALVRHGILQEGSLFKFEKAEDINKLMEMVIKLLQYYDIDPAWIYDKFGIEVKDKKVLNANEASSQSNRKLKAELPANFFD
jgi:phage gp29-like protein